MTKKNFLKKNESTISNLILLAFVFVIATLAIPAIGYADALTSPAYWVSIVDFFADVKVHISSYWMFYTLGGALLFAYLRKK